jgi:hypothetical protein
MDFLILFFFYNHIFHLQFLSELQFTVVASSTIAYGFWQAMVWDGQFQSALQSPFRNLVKDLGRVSILK